MRRALPPVGWQSTVEHEPQITTVCAWENTVVLRGGERAHCGRGRAKEPAGRERGRTVSSWARSGVGGARWERKSMASDCHRAECPRARRSARRVKPPADEAGRAARMRGARERAHVVAARALDVHEERVGRGDLALKLVLARLQLRRRVQQVDVADPEDSLPHGRSRLVANAEAGDTRIAHPDPSW